MNQGSELRLICGTDIPDDPTFSECAWGGWRLHPDGTSLHLVVNGTELYWFTLLKIQDSASMLDWIYQVQAKGWSAPIMAGLICALGDIFEPQANLCSFALSGRKGKRLPRYYLRDRKRELLKRAKHMEAASCSS
jgi:hypothetical protein